MYKYQHQNIDRVQRFGSKSKLLVDNISGLNLLRKAIDCVCGSFLASLRCCVSSAVGKVENVARPTQAEQEGLKLREDVTEHIRNIKAFCFPPSLIFSHHFFAIELMPIWSNACDPPSSVFAAAAKGKSRPTKPPSGMLEVETPIKGDEKAAQQTAFLARLSDQTRDVSMRKAKRDAEQEW